MRAVIVPQSDGTGIYIKDNTVVNDAKFRVGSRNTNKKLPTVINLANPMCLTNFTCAC